MNKTVLTAFAVAFLFSAEAATAQPWLVELNAAHAGDLDGGELGLGYSLAKGNFRLTPIVGAFLYKGDNDRYRSETFSNGNKVCRDGTNGRFADKENCNNTAAKAYGKIEAAYRFEQKFELGGGVRVSSQTTPYGTLGLYLSDQFAIKAFGGKDYYGAGLIARF